MNMSGIILNPMAAGLVLAKSKTFRRRITFACHWYGRNGVIKAVEAGVDGVLIRQFLLCPGTYGHLQLNPSCHLTPKALSYDTGLDIPRWKNCCLFTAMYVKMAKFEPITWCR